MGAKRKLFYMELAFKDTNDKNMINIDLKLFRSVLIVYLFNYTIKKTKDKFINV